LKITCLLFANLNVFVGNHWVFFPSAHITFHNNLKIMFTRYSGDVLHTDSGNVTVNVRGNNMHKAIIYIRCKDKYKLQQFRFHSIS